MRGTEKERGTQTHTKIERGEHHPSSDKGKKNNKKEIQIL